MVIPVFGDIDRKVRPHWPEVLFVVVQTVFPKRRTDCGLSGFDGLYNHNIGR